jgi:phospholipid/cholesterol/gamma-HCH transport system substrate-binding protein
METEKKIRIKKFFYGIMAFIILLNLILTNKNRVGEDVNNYFATFNKIDGVSVGTDVVISGIKVGEVKEIFIKDNYPNISMNVNKNLEISDDSSVSIQTDGLFGKKFLLIEIGGNDVYLKSGEKFSFSEDSIVIEELLGKIILIGEKNKGL